jgi:diamine N-acetyltransferase
LSTISGEGGHTQKAIGAHGDLYDPINPRDPPTIASPKSARAKFLILLPLLRANLVIGGNSISFGKTGGCPNMPLHIRAATKDDLTVLAQLNEPVQSLHAALYPADFKGNVEAGNVASFFERAAARPESSIAIAEQDGVPVGYIWFDISARPENAFKPPQSFVYIHHVSVAADARHRGVGSAMLAYAKEKAHAAGVDEVRLDTWIDNVEAQRFFEAHGFAPFIVMLRQPVFTP